MKKIAYVLALAFFCLTIQAQETPAKEKAKKESTSKKQTKKSSCSMESKKCCSSKKTN